VVYLTPQQDTAAEVREDIMATPKRALVGIVIAVAMIAVGACSATGSPPSAAVSGAPAQSSASAGAADVCADATAVETALKDLKDLDFKTVGTAGLTAGMDKVRSSITTLASSAKDAAGPEVQALTGALDTLRTAIENLTTDASVAEKAADIRAAATGVETAAKALKAALTQCS
jgi:hypothetical protein